MFAQVFSAIVVILAFTAGSLLIQWLGEQIDVKGIGNGISILIFAGIVSRWTSIFTTIKTWLGLAAGGEVKYYFLIPVLVVLAVAVVVFIVILNAAERRHPGPVRKARCRPQDVRRAEHAHPHQGEHERRYAGHLRQCAGLHPGTIAGFFPNLYNAADHPFAAPFLRMFSTTGWVYAAIYLLLIIAFNYFYVAMQYNPVEIANNLRNNNGHHPRLPSR